MNKFYNETLYKLEAEIKELEIETDCPIQRIEAVIDIILIKLSLDTFYFEADHRFSTSHDYKVVLPMT